MMWFVASSDAGAVPAWEIAYFAAAIAWVTLWAQLWVKPFYDKSEQLHKDYAASGKINAAVAAIEADQLIPALSRMILGVIGAQSDKRKRLEGEIEALLHTVQFLPDLKSVQSAMTKMEAPEDGYQRLKSLAKKIWIWGLAHAALSLAVPVIHILLLRYDDRWEWALAGCALAWFATLAFGIFGLFRFHSKLVAFTASLEVESVE